ncbi:hypothetical protein [Leptotrichia sp. oral taxon 879]|uniref:hypothetical protein n=1 Tax=Leptotrichia sp. oral taxon 879 TaxID=1227267 RepID=UPI0003AE2DFF|nr:hypothetical protein [Leptotrichia sp. oral taxon 879]ERK52650.1 hypothetical protein HMPREF1552_00677 [Leptotrichia sp. oral taxon 879 str. F0557]
MDFKSLQKELFERKFKLDEYMGNTFDIFGSIVKENKLWVVILVILNIWTLYSTTLQNTINTSIRTAASYGDVSNMAKYSGTQLGISFLNTVVSVYSTLFSIMMYSKVVMKIEGRENEYSFKKIFFKFLKIFGLTIMFFAIFFIVMLIPVLIGIIIGTIAEYNYSTVLIVVAISIPVVTWIAVVVIAWIKLLYFRETFYIRDMKIIETYKYNLAISKGNKLRKILPNIVLSLIVLVFALPFLLNMFLFTFLFTSFYVVILIAAVSSIATSAIGIVSIILNSLIFLNVEYNYLKSIDEKKEETQI